MPLNRFVTKKRKPTAAALGAIALGAAIGLSSAAGGQCLLTESAKLLAADGAANDRFGDSVAISGDVAIVGADGDDDNGIAAGAAYVYRYDGAQWIEEAKLLASDAAPHEAFGFSVALDGDVAIVGAPGRKLVESQTGAASPGAAYVFRYTGSVWTEEAKLLASDGEPGDRFGETVAVSGGTAVVGSPQDDNANGPAAGAVYTFRKSAGVWAQHQQVLASQPAAGDNFGQAVAAHLTTVVIGAPRRSSPLGLARGSAYVFENTKAGLVEVARLEASDTADEKAPQRTDALRLVGGVATVADEFGGAVAIDADLVIVGGLDAVCIFRRTLLGPWRQEARLVSEGELGLGFGGSVAISGNTAVVGVIGANDNGSRSGAAYRYRFDSVAWVPKAKLLASDGAADDGLGGSVAISGDLAIIAAPGNDTNGNAAGAAYTYRVSPPPGCGAACSADVDPPGGDGVVDIHDLLVVLENFGTRGGRGDVDGSGTVDVMDQLAVLRAFGSCASGPPGTIFVSNGTGGGDWDDPNTWIPALVPASVEDYDSVRILPGDTVTQSAPLPNTLGYYLLEAGATHVFLGTADLAALSVDAHGIWVPDVSTPELIVVRNAAELWPAPEVAIDRHYDCPVFCDLITNACPPYDALCRCTDECAGNASRSETASAPFANTTTHRALTAVAVDNQQCILDSYLKQELLITLGIDQTATLGATTQRYADWIVDGSDLEDVPACRVLNHFLEPITNTPLTVGGIALGQTADAWANDGFSVDCDASPITNYFDFFDARDYYQAALTSPQPADRSAFAALTFRALGQVLHLIEDQAVGAHTRNDQHLIPLTRLLENHASLFFGTVPQLDALPNLVTIPAAPAPPRYLLIEPLPGHTSQFDFFDTGQWTGQPNFGVGFVPGFTSQPGLSEYSNFNFFSRDTIFKTGPFPHPSFADTNFAALFPPPFFGQVLISPNNPLTSTVSNPFVYVSKTTPPAIGVDPIERLCAAKNRGLSLAAALYGDYRQRIEVGIGDPPVLDEYLHLALPKAIAYCTDYVNYFFRGKVDAQLAGNATTGLLELTVTNRSGEGIGPGTWSLWQDSAGGERSIVLTDFSAAPTVLSDDIAFVATFAPTNRAGPYTLVFEGAPGTEMTIGKSLAPPVGACEVVSDDCCTQVVEPECVARSGTFRGQGTDCSASALDPCGTIEVWNDGNEFEIPPDPGPPLPGTPYRYRLFVSGVNPPNGCFNSISTSGSVTGSYAGWTDPDSFIGAGYWRKIFHDGTPIVRTTWLNLDCAPPMGAFDEKLVVDIREFGSGLLSINCFPIRSNGSFGSPYWSGGIFTVDHPVGVVWEIETAGGSATIYKYIAQP